MRNEFDLSSMEEAIVRRASEFAAAEIEPAAATWEREHRVPVNTLTGAARYGLLGLIVPTEFGGFGLRASAMAAVMETLAASDFFVAFALVVHNNLAAAIAREGSVTQRARHLPPMLCGEHFGAFLLTEPGGGSDAAAIRTRARKSSSAWLLDGEKAWISNGTHAQVLSVYAQTDLAAGWRGIAAFLVAADTPGVQRLPAYALHGGHSLGTAGFRFDRCELDEESLFLPPGRAFKAAMEGIDLARVNVAAMCCGMLGRAIALASRHVRDRHAFGRPLADQQGLVWMLADAATDLAAARALVREAAAALDRRSPATLPAAHAKKFATRVAFSRLADCMQALGAAGLDDAHPLGRHLTAAKIAQYLDGTTEIQNIVIGRAVLGNMG